MDAELARRAQPTGHWRMTTTLGLGKVAANVRARLASTALGIPATAMSAARPERGWEWTAAPARRAQPTGHWRMTTTLGLGKVAANGLNQAAGRASSSGVGTRNACCPSGAP